MDRRPPQSCITQTCSAGVVEGGSPWARFEEARVKNSLELDAPQSGDPRGLGEEGEDEWNSEVRYLHNTTGESRTATRYFYLPDRQVLQEQLDFPSMQQSVKIRQLAGRDMQHVLLRHAWTYESHAFAASCGRITHLHVDACAGKGRRVGTARWNSWLSFAEPEPGPSL